MVWLQVASAAPQSTTIRFEDVTLAAGVSFQHHDGGTARRHLPATMGAGVAWLDYDQDGRADLYLVQSGPLPDGSTPSAADAGTGANALLRQRPDRTFQTIPGAAADRGYGKGVSVADYDNDGHPDIFVGNWGADVLYRNNGDGTFSDVSSGAGVDDPRLTSSSGWADFDGDGWLDLFAVSYVRYEIATAMLCEDRVRGIVDYCHPAIFDGQKDMLYGNRGDGTFTDRSEALTGARDIDGKGLALTIMDLDEDGRLDVYVANDTTPNFAYFNRGEGFQENGELTGLGVGDSGQPQAGMGVDFGDVDGNGTFELVVTNFEDEPYNLYRSIAPGFYVDETYAVGLGATSRSLLGFGVVLADYDADGDLDVSVANGHILAFVDDYRQPNQVLTNQLTTLRAVAERNGELLPPGPAAPPPSWLPSGTLFVDTSADAGEAISRRRVSRGMAVADYDADGRLDLAVTNVNDSAELLHNVSAAGNSITLRLRGRSSSRDAVGAEVLITPCRDADCVSPTDGVVGYAQRYPVKIGASFASQSLLDVVAGLGAATRAHVEVVWPDGQRADLGTLPAGARVLLIEGQAPVVAAGAGR
jgi:hypothetical protein